MRLDGFGNNLWLDSSGQQSRNLFARLASSPVVYRGGKAERSIPQLLRENTRQCRAASSMVQQWQQILKLKYEIHTRRRRRLMWLKCVANFATSTGVTGTSLAGPGVSQIRAGIMIAPVLLQPGASPHAALPR